MEVIAFFDRAKIKKIKYPSLKILLTMIKEKGFSKTGKEFGCSDNAIRKHLKKNGIDFKNMQCL